MKLIKILLTLLVFFIPVLSQNKKYLEIIKSNYYNLKTFQSKLNVKKIVDLSGSAEGAEIVYFFNDLNNVLIVEVEILGETSKSNQNYYFINDSLSFLFVCEEYYNAPTSTLLMSVEELEKNGMERLDHNKSAFSENRFYFFRGKLIKWVDKNHKSVSDTTLEFSRVSNNYLDYSMELLNIFSSQN